MREFRLGRNTTEHYSSFAECAKAWGRRPVNRKTNDEAKLLKQQEAFCDRHKCKACGEPMTYLTGSNSMACTNEKCKGIKDVRTDKEGNEYVVYLPSFELLDNKGAEIARNIFA